MTSQTEEKGVYTEVAKKAPRRVRLRLMRCSSPPGCRHSHHQRAARPSASVGSAKALNLQPAEAGTTPAPVSGDTFSLPSSSADAE